MWNRNKGIAVSFFDGPSKPKRSLLADLLAPEDSIWPTPPAPSLGALLNPAPTFLGSAGEPNRIARLLADPPQTFLGTPAPRVLPIVAQPDVSRLAYFAFDFDDIIRVTNVRNSGKIGQRVNGNSRGFKDRSVWEKSNAKSKLGLKQFMQRSTKGSGVVCVLIGSSTWQSFWVRYEIALAVIGERGLLAVDLNSIPHYERKTPDALGVNPLKFMGVHRHTDGNWYLIERHVIESQHGLDFEWRWYQEYKQPVKRPAYIPDLPIGTIVALSENTARYDYKANNGFENMGSWFDLAARNAGR